MLTLARPSNLECCQDFLTNPRHLEYRRCIQASLEDKALLQHFFSNVQVPKASSDLRYRQILLEQHGTGGFPDWQIGSNQFVLSCLTAAGADDPVTRWDMRLPMDASIYRALEEMLGKSAGDEVKLEESGNLNMFECPPMPTRTPSPHHCC